MRLPLFLMGLVLLAGCAHDEFDLLAPADQKTHIGRSEPATASLPPLTYSLLAVSNRLQMRIDNPTAQPVTLRPDLSYAVDAGGQSRRVPGLTIAPGSFAQFLLPPLRPYVQDDGPRFGVGIETAGGFHNGGGFGDAGYYGGPQPIAGLDENTYWDWPRDGVVRFHFVYASPPAMNWTNDLTLQRVKP